MSELHTYKFTAVTIPVQQVQLEVRITVDGLVMASSQGEATDAASKAILEDFKKKRKIVEFFINKVD